MRCAAKRSANARSRAAGARSRSPGGTIEAVEMIVEILEAQLFLGRINFGAELAQAIAELVRSAAEGEGVSAPIRIGHRLQLRLDRPELRLVVILRERRRDK